MKERGIIISILSGLLTVVLSVILTYIITAKSFREDLKELNVKVTELDSKYTEIKTILDVEVKNIKETMSKIERNVDTIIENHYN